MPKKKKKCKCNKSEACKIFDDIDKYNDKKIQEWVPLTFGSFIRRKLPCCK